jgi:ABC-type Fe3+ transport system permease subunit
LVVLPLLNIFFDSFFKEGVFGFANYLEIFNEKTFMLLLKSLELAFLVAMLSTVIGAFFAFFLTKTNLPFKNLFKLLFLVPLFLSPYILTLSWVDFFVYFEQGKVFIYSFWGVVFVLTLVFTPLSMLVLSSAFSNINAKLEEAGLMMTSYPEVVFKIILPLVKPAILSSFILVFVLALSEFSVPAFLSVKVLTTEIFTQFSAFYNHGLALANAMILVFISIFLLLSERFYLADASFLSLGSKSQQSKIVELGKAKYPLFLLHLLYLLFSVVVPIVVLSIQGLHGGGAYFFQAITLLLPNIINSLLYASLGALVLLLFGFVFAYMSVKENYRAVDTLLLIIFAVPSTVLGIGLIKFFNTASLDAIYSSFWIIIIAYLGKFVFISHKLIGNALIQIPKSLEESAQMMGAGFFMRMQKIVLPLIADKLFIVFLVGFIFSLGELGATILVYPAGEAVMGIKLYTIMANAPQSLVSAMSLVILLVTVFSVGSMMLFYRVFKLILR